MLALKNYRDKAEGLPDLLNYASLVDNGILLNKDGSLTIAYTYLGSDLASSTDSDLGALSARVNGVLASFGTGWMIQTDLLRIETKSYDFSNSHFSDRVSRLIEEERRQYFLSGGKGFESVYVVILTYLPPLKLYSRFQELLFSDDIEVSSERSLADRILTYFLERVEKFESELSTVVRVERLTDFTIIRQGGHEENVSSILRYLNLLVKGEEHPIRLPCCPMYIDSLIGSQNLWNGLTPKIGSEYLAVVAISGFPMESYPSMLEALDSLPLEYRWHNRFIFLDPELAKSDFKKYQRKWEQKQRGIISQLLNTKGRINQDAVGKTAEIDSAIAEIDSGLVAYGYYTSVVVLRDEDRELLGEKAKLILNTIKGAGFDCRLEDVNCLEAFLGSLPGHGKENVRRPLINTMNLADIIPLTAIWPGRSINPCPLYPADSPPLFQGVTNGSTPFWFNLHYGDVGHTLIFGPTGTGKSVLLNFIMAQFRRYPNAKIVNFGNKYADYPIVKACGGVHYDIGGDSGGPQFCPLALVTTDGSQLWAEEWIKTCLKLQGVVVTPEFSSEIHRAMSLLRRSKEKTITDFVTTLQNMELKAALEPYTLSGSYGNLLDASEDSFNDHSFVSFEMGKLLQQGEKIMIPVLLYLFYRVELSLKGDPTLIVLDEAWVPLSHPVFREKIKEWLKVKRDSNVAVVLATQSISDAANSGILDILLESCPTRIFLPNPSAEDELPSQFYRKMGLNDRQINIVKNAIKKLQYYYCSPEGNRLFELGLGPIGLSFFANSQEELRELKKIEADSENWIFDWLEKKGVSYENYISA